MNKQPLVSVIIPVFNVEKYLNECVDSVILQTYKNIEVILVDDGSTDSSGEICDDYAQKYNNIKVIHKENGGQSSARNLGLELAQGKYIYFMDSDDIILSDAFVKLVKIAENNCADIVFFDAESFVDGANFKITNNYIREHVYETTQGIKMLCELCENGEYHCSVPLLLLKRDLLIKANISFIEGMFYEDMVYTFVVFCLAEKAAQCKQILYKRRYRPNSTMTSRKSKKYFYSITKAYDAVRDFSKENGIVDTDVAKKYITRLAFNIFNDYYKLSKNDKKICRTDFRSAKKDILSNNSYGNRELKSKCHSNLLWVIYKIYKKTIGKFQK